MKDTIKKKLHPYREKTFSPLLEILRSQELRIDELRVKVDQLSTSIKEVKTSIIPISERLIIVKIFSDLKICLDPTDVAVVPHLALDGIWEKNMTKAWTGVLKKDQVVLDVGANFGYYGLLAAQRNFSVGQKIIFFEANPDLVPYINKTLSINGLHKNSKVENVGISEKKGTAELTILEDFIGCSSLHTAQHLSSYLEDKMPVEAHRKVKVPTISLDEYCGQNKIANVDLIKLDIEGYEEIAYKGMTGVVKSSKNLILFLEFTKESYENPRLFYSQLLKDFRYLYLINENGDLDVPASNEYDEIIGNIENFVMLILSKTKLV